MRRRFQANLEADERGIPVDLVLDEHKLRGEFHSFTASRRNPGGNSYEGWGSPAVWDLDSGEKNRSFEGSTGLGLEAADEGVAFTPDGEAFVTGDFSSSVILSDSMTGEMIRRYATEGDTPVPRVDVNSDGSAVIAAYRLPAELETQPRLYSSGICRLGSNCSGLKATRNGCAIRPSIRLAAKLFLPP